MKKTLKIGTRASALALAQSGQVRDQIQRQFTDWQVELVLIKTEGDRLSQNGQSAYAARTEHHLPVRGVFTKEIEDALLAKKIDCAVHSYKDMACAMMSDLAIAAVPVRANAQDCWVSAKADCLTKESTVKVGTSSLRRQIQLRQFYPNLNVQNLRGNLDSRLQKVKDGQLDAVVLAMAGIDRLLDNKEKTGLHFKLMDYHQMVPAPAQGALALQVRAEDSLVLSMLKFLDDAPTRLAVDCERAFLAQLGAGCSAPVGAYARIEKDQIILDVMLGSWDLKQMVRKQITVPVKTALESARLLAQQVQKDLNL